MAAGVVEQLAAAVADGAEPGRRRAGRVLAGAGRQLGVAGDHVAPLDRHLDAAAVAAAGGVALDCQVAAAVGLRRQPDQRQREHEAGLDVDPRQRRRLAAHVDLLAVAGDGQRDDALAGPVGDPVRGAGAVAWRHLDQAGHPHAREPALERRVAEAGDHPVELGQRHRLPRQGGEDRRRPTVDEGLDDAAGGAALERDRPVRRPLQPVLEGGGDEQQFAAQHGQLAGDRVRRLARRPPGDDAERAEAGEVAAQRRLRRQPRLPAQLGEPQRPARERLDDQVVQRRCEEDQRPSAGPQRTHVSPRVHFRLPS